MVARAWAGGEGNTALDRDGSPDPDGVGNGAGRRATVLDFGPPIAGETAEVMRLDGVEIKATIAGDATPQAIRALGLPAGKPPWDIYFCEDVTVGLAAATPLLDAGVVLRARAKPGGKDDTTTKLRPCRRSQLTDHWLAAGKDDDWEFKVEADWAGSRRALAASLTADRRNGIVAAVGRGERPVEDLFIDEQLAYLRDCAGIAINLATLTVLPPVTATRWGSVEGTPGGLDLRAERWTVEDLDFLELSAVVPVDEAPAALRQLAGFVESLDVGAPPDQETKTRQVLQHLVERVLARGPAVTA
jgi:hypothetical protein